MDSSHSNTEFSVQYRDNITTRAGRFSLRTRDFYELYTYIYGEGPYFYFVDDRIFEIKPGDILFIRPGVLVGSCKKKQARYTRLVVKIPIYVMDFLSQIDPICSKILREGDISIFHPSKAGYDEYFSYVRELRELSLRNDKHKDTLMLSVLFKMLALLADEYRGGYVPLSDELVARVIDTVNREYANISSVGELAEKMNYSKNYLSQYFKSRMNMGLHDFLITKKLSVAAAGLSIGKSVTEVAFECGFGSVAYFIRIFKEKYGVTPGKYNVSDS